MKKFFSKLISNSNFANEYHILRTKFRTNLNNIDPHNSWSTEPTQLNDINFFNWFDSVSNFEELKTKASNDFEYAVSSKIPIDKTKTILEIGFGGGRLSVEACKFSKFYIGIDIHENFKSVENYINNNGFKNFQLYHFNKLKNISSFDLAYSFIVIQHFSKLKILEDYLDFLNLKLNPNGSVILWYAKLKTKIFGDFYSVPPEKFRKRECSLFIHKDKMEKLIESRGFKIIEHSIDNKRVGNKVISGQSYVIFTNK